MTSINFFYALQMHRISELLYIYIYTVKPVLRRHYWDKEKVALEDKWPLKGGSIHMNLSMKGQEKVTF